MWSVITVFVFLLSKKAVNSIKRVSIHPMLISILIIIALLVVYQVPYKDYYQETHWISQFLELAVVALAFPIYEYIGYIRENWKLIAVTCLVGSTLGILSTLLIALSFGADKGLIASLLGKSITTSIAMQVSEQLGGVPSITAVVVLCIGILGASIAYPLFRLFGVTIPAAKGVSVRLGVSCVGDSKMHGAKPSRWSIQHNCTGSVWSNHGDYCSSDVSLDVYVKDNYATYRNISG